MNDFPFGASRKRGIVAKALGLSLVLIVSLRPVHASPLELLVPAYFYPGGPDLAYWNQLNAAAAQVSLTVIFNPATGPGTVADPNYSSAVTRLRAAGAKTLAYINTDYGNRSLAAMQEDVDNYLRLYPDQENGFFLDLVSTDTYTAHLDTYKALYKYIKGKNRAFRIIGNPGTSGPRAYFTQPAVDTLITFENYAAHYPGYVPDSYTSGYSADHFGHILHDEPSAAAMRNELKLAQRRNAGYVYITDVIQSNTHPNAYDRLPSYWDQEVAAIRATAAPKTGSGSSSLEISALGPLVARRSASGSVRRPD